MMVKLEVKLSDSMCNEEIECEGVLWVDNLGEVVATN